MRSHAEVQTPKRHSPLSIGAIAIVAVVAAAALAAYDAAHGASVIIPSTPDAPGDEVVLQVEAALEAERQQDLDIALQSIPELEPLRAAEIITRGELQRGDTLASAMRREDVSAGVIHLVATQTSSAFNYRRSQPGHRFRLVQDLEGKVLEFRYLISEIDTVHLRLIDGEYVVKREEAEVTPRVTRIAGVVTSSLYHALRDLGEGAQLANDFADVFAYDVDFSRTVQRGDEFRMLYERLYHVDDDGNEIYVGPGRILAARYGGTVGEHTAVYFEPEEGRGGYYRPDGSSVERRFLMAPLRYSRVSSRFASARRHPILKVTRPHHGIDYAAKTGTPVWSVSDGKVIYRSRAGGFGNLVKVRHANGYISYYAHLSRFADNLNVGDTVQQKQVIGYVGQTGLATGPHVCFRVAKNGRYVNPARVQSPPATPIPDEARPSFLAARDTLLSELDAGPYVASGDAL